MNDIAKMIIKLENRLTVTDEIKTDFITVTVGEGKRILEILKKHLPVPAVIEGGGTSWWYVCDECHGMISKGDKFCNHCGQAVNWDG